MESQAWYQRRKHPRYDVDLNAALIVSDQYREQEVACKIKSLSRHGMSVLTSGSSQIFDDPLKVKMDLPNGKAVMTDLMVVRRDAQAQEQVFGGEMLFGSEENRRRINLLLRSLGKSSVSDRRQGDRRQQRTHSSVERRKTERRLDFGVLGEAVSFQRRSPFWRAEYTFFRQTEKVQPGRIRVNGRDLINYGSRDYLGLAHHPDVKQAAMDVIEECGVDSGSRAFTGTLAIHEELERELAAFKGYESALVFSGGYIANVAILTGLLRAGDVVFFDEKVHASAMDGCTFSGAKAVPFKHNSLSDLEKKVKSAPCHRRLLVVNGVYSVQGDLSPLPMIKDFATVNRIPILLDDAHGFGILGENGTGTAEHFGMKGGFELDMGTMAGALGGFGGFVASKSHVINYLKHFSRPFLFTTALPPFAAAAMLRSLTILKADPGLRAKLWGNIMSLRRGLTDLAIKFWPTESAILAIPVGNEQITYEIVRTLESRGIYVNTFVRPAVRRDLATVRLAVSASHSDRDILETLNVFEDIKKLFKTTFVEHRT